MLCLLSQAVERIQQFGSEQAVDNCTDEQLMSYLHPPCAPHPPSPTPLTPLLLSVACACRQWSGVNGVTFFAPQIFAGIQARLGEGNQGPLIAAILVNGVQLIATIFTVIMVDKIGRRSLLLSGSMLGFAAEVAVAIVLAVSAGTSATELPLAASVVSIVLVSACACACALGTELLVMGHGEEDWACAAAVWQAGQALQAEHYLRLLLGVVLCVACLAQAVVHLHPFLCCSMYCGDSVSMQCVLCSNDKACCADWVVFHRLWVLMGTYWVVATLRDP